MAKSIADLAVMLSANTGPYSAGLNRAKGQTRDFSESVTRTVGKIARVFAALGAAAAAVSIAGVTSEVRRLNSVGHTAAKLGVTTEALTRLQYAGEQTDVKIETLNMALQRMTRRIAEAAGGTGEARDALKELGLDAEALNTMGPAAAMSAIADAMQNVTNQGDRVRLAMKLFDSEGVALVNTLSGGSAALARFAEESDKTGNTVGGKTAASAMRLTDSINRLRRSLGGLFAVLAGAVAPAIEKLTDKAASLAAAFQKINLQAHETKILNIAAVASFAAGMAIAAKLVKVIQLLVAAYKSLSVAQAITAALSGPKGWAMIAGGLLAAGIAAATVSKLFDKVGQDSAAAAAKVDQAGVDTDQVVQSITDSVNDLGSAIDGVTDGPMSEAIRRAEALSSAYAEAASRAAAIFESTRTPAERLAVQLAEIRDLFLDGHISAETMARALKQIGEMDIQPEFSMPATSRQGSSRVSFAAMGAASAAGIQTDKMTRLEKEQLEEAKLRRSIQERTLAQIRNLSGSEKIRVVNF